jgi:hypothetical protein
MKNLQYKATNHSNREEYAMQRDVVTAGVSSLFNHRSLSFQPNVAVVHRND